MRNLPVILILSLIISCNSEPKKEVVSESSEIKKANGTEAITQQASKNHDKQELEESIHFSSKSDRLFFLFSENQKEGDFNVFKGISSNLMSFLLVDYITRKYLDQERYNNEPKDEILLSFEDKSFSYTRLSISDITEYDIEKFQVNNSHRLGFREDEDMTDEEIKEWDNEHQQMLDDIDPELKNIKKHDRFIVKGGWRYQRLKNDSLILSIDVEMKDTDPYEFEAYGEEFLYVEEHIEDTLIINLFELMYQLGQVRKYKEQDLYIVDLQNLTYIRNQFYARKGYKFKTEKMQDFFGTKQWYNGSSDDVTNQLSETELYNINFIKDLESSKK